MSVRVNTASLIVLACLATGAALADGAPSSAEIATSLFDTLSATALPCDETAAGIDLPGSTVACARVSKSWGPVKKALNRMERKLPDSRRMSDFTTHLEGLRQRFMLAADGAVGVAYHDETRTLTVFRHHPCWDDTELERFGPRVPTEDTHRELRPLQQPRVEYPEQARVAHAEGEVLVHALVITDGTVEDACVVDSSYRGVGFEQAALDAVRLHRYPPLQRNLLIPVKLSWHFGP